MPLAVEILKQRQAQKKTAAAAPVSAPAQPTVGFMMEPALVRAQVIAQQRKSLAKRLHLMSFERGQLLFDGQWGCSKTVRRAYRRMWTRSLMHIGESLLVLALLVASAGFFGLMLALLAGLDLGGP